MPLPLAIPIAAAGAKLALGAYQTISANNKLKRLGKMPEYDITPEQRSSQIRAEKMAKFGYSPQEAAAFEQSLARSGNTSFQRGMTIGGGGVSQALNAAINSNNINARLGFAADNARLKRQNIQYADQRGDIISNQRNRGTAQKLAYRLAVEQALGGAKSQGQLNMVESVSDLPYVFMQNEYLKSLNHETVDAVDYTVEDIPLSNTGTTLPTKKPSMFSSSSKGYTGMVKPTFGPQLRTSPVYNR